MKRRQFSKKKRAEIVALYRDGKGLNPIARQEHCSPQVIRATLVAEGEEIRSPGRPRRLPDEDLIAAYREHGSIRKAAEAIDYSDAGLAYRLDIANEIPQRRRAGSPDDARAVLERAVKPGAPDECWEARGPQTQDGYVMLKEGRRLKTAHRLAWEVYQGRDVPSGMFVTHECDNPKCANPHHLRLGTPKENTRQMLARNRSGRAKLQVEDVVDVRLRAAAGESIDMIAADYPVGRQQIRRIVNGTSWTNI